MDYQHKYLKYKEKYLNLRAKNLRSDSDTYDDMLGGGIGDFLGSLFGTNNGPKVLVVNLSSNVKNPSSFFKEWSGLNFEEYQVDRINDPSGNDLMKWINGKKYDAIIICFRLASDVEDLFKQGVKASIKERKLASFKKALSDIKQRKEGWEQTIELFEKLEHNTVTPGNEFICVYAQFNDKKDMQDFINDQSESRDLGEGGTVLVIDDDFKIINNDYNKKSFESFVNKNLK